MQKQAGGDQTQVIEDKKEKIQLKPEPNKQYYVLKMHKKVTWAEDVVNNEGMGLKKSNICCIYHKPKLSPDDSDTSSCDSCDEKGKNAYERPNHYDRKAHHNHNHGDGTKKIK